MLIKQMILIVLGLSSGVAVAAGTFAAITGIGVVPRFADRTHTGNHIIWYEDCATLGGIIGNLVYLYHIRIPGGLLVITLYGLGSGIFVGCMVMALAEILNVFPIFTRRLKITKGLSFLIIAMALGKIAGSLFQFLSRW